MKRIIITPLDDPRGASIKISRLQFEPHEFSLMFDSRQDHFVADWATDSFAATATISILAKVIVNNTFDREIELVLHETRLTIPPRESRPLCGLAERERSEFQARLQIGPSRSKVATVSLTPKDLSRFSFKRAITHIAASTRQRRKHKQLILDIFAPLVLYNRTSRPLTFSAPPPQIQGVFSFRRTKLATLGHCRTMKTTRE
jgi:hypothetical protein